MNYLNKRITVDNWKEVHAYSRKKNRIKWLDASKLQLRPITGEEFKKLKPGAKGVFMEIPGWGKLFCQLELTHHNHFSFLLSLYRNQQLYISNKFKS